MSESLKQNDSLNQINEGTCRESTAWSSEEQEVNMTFTERHGIKFAEESEVDMMQGNERKSSVCGVVNQQEESNPKQHPSVSLHLVPFTALHLILVYFLSLTGF